MLRFKEFTKEENEHVGLAAYPKWKAGTSSQKEKKIKEGLINMAYLLVVINYLQLIKIPEFLSVRISKNF